MTRFVLFIFSAFILLESCTDSDLQDSDFRIDVIKNPDAALRSFFFVNMQDSIEFYQFGRPEADTAAGRKFGIRLVPPAGNKDTLTASYNQPVVIQVEKDSSTPASASITNLYLSLPENQAYWRFRSVNGTQLSQINLRLPTLLRPGTFPIQVSGLIEKIVTDTSGRPKKISATVPHRTITVKLR